MAKRSREAPQAIRLTYISVANVGTGRKSDFRTSPAVSNDQSRVDRIERQLALLERDQAALSSIISSSAPHGKDSVRVTQNPDKLWSCKKCGSRLGFYDLEHDLLRVRYKDFVAYVHLGVGGVIQVLFRQCSEMNEVHYVSTEENDKNGPT